MSLTALNTNYYTENDTVTDEEVVPDSLRKLKTTLRRFKNINKNLKKEIKGCVASSQEAIETVGEINGYIKGEERKS